MANSSVQIEELAHHLHLGPLLARWHVAEWQHLYPSWDVPTAEREFAEQSVAGQVPTTFVAFDGTGRGEHHVLGSISIIHDDELPGFEHLGPWLASLYVPPHARGRGVGTLLMRSSVTAAHAMGLPQLHLFSSGQEDYHRRLGWRTVARTTANGHDAAVMTMHTSPRAARQAVVSSWWTDPDTAGAYSFLRVGGTPDHRRLLTGEVAPGLRLAGEHTSVDHPGTLHGAWLSGERAARSLLDAADGTQTATPDHPVVVVGGGLAGLAAARTLRAAGAPALVLEAKESPGGRARTDWSLGGPVHLGGAWLHGVDGHPLVELGATGTPSTWDTARTFVRGIGAVPDDHLQERFEAGQARLAAAAAASAHDVTVSSLLPAELDRAAEDDPVARAVLSEWWRTEYENLYAAPLGEVSARNGTEPFRLAGPDLLLTTPLSDVVARAADGLDVRCGRRVAALHRTPDGWRVEQADGTVLAAAAVIVTIPIGALRSGRIAFHPPLEPAVVEATHRIGAGPVAKVFATFDERWWAPATCWFLADDPPATLAVWVDVSALTGRPTLCGFVAGERTAMVEAMTEDEACRLVDAELSAFGVAGPPG